MKPIASQTLKTGSPTELPNGKLVKSQTLNSLLRQMGGGMRFGMAGPQFVDPMVIPIQNTTLTAVPAYGVLGIESVLFNPALNVEAFASRPIIAGVTPVQGSYTNFFAVAKERIVPGEIGPAFIFGATWVKIEILSEDHWFADVKGDVIEMKTVASGGTEILWKESGTGTLRWALIRFGGAGGTATGLDLLYIDSARTAGEVYKAYIVNLTTTLFDTTSGSFSFSQIGNITAATEVTAINAQEGDGSATHYLTDSPQRLRLVLGYLLPCLDDADRACYLIVAKDFESECLTP